MASSALKPSVAVGQLLRKKRQELRLTLRDVSDRLASKGERIPISTLARVEQGKLDPGVRRLHLLLRLYDVPEHLVSDLVELEALAVDPTPDGDLETLYRRGVEHWKSGNAAEGLAHLMAVRQHVPADEASRLMRQKVTLGFAIASRGLGKTRLAKQLVDDLLCEPPHPALMANVLVVASSLWCGLGSREAALAFLRRATAHLRPEDHQQMAWVLHQQASVLLEVERPGEAGEVLDQALAHYRAMNDTYGEAQALVARTQALKRLGRLEDALACARQLTALCEQHGHAKPAVAGYLELGRLLVRSGQAREGLAVLREALGKAILQENRNAQFFAHYYLWKAYEGLGDGDRARFEREAARYFVRFLDEPSPEADEVRALPGR